MGEHEKRPVESEIRDPMESPSTKPDPDENVAPHKSPTNWDGYSLEILSIWFDP
jgi:hypothetical protein